MKGKGGCPHREETILFSIFSHFLLRYRRRFWGILGGFWRGAGTIIEGGDVRCVLRHNSLDETFGLTRTLPHPMTRHTRPGSHNHPSRTSSRPLLSLLGAACSRCFAGHLYPRHREFRV